MTAKASFADVQARVQAALESSQTCSDETPRSVQRLLLPGLKGTTELQDGPQNKSRKPDVAKASAKRPIKNVKAATNGDLDASSLTSEEKNAFATDVINVSLKTLNEEVRHTVRSTSLSPVKKNVSATRHLQETTPNKPAKQPSTLKGVNLGNDQTEVFNVRNVAKCAHIAFEYLGSMNCSKSDPFDPQCWQLENGIVALVSKLVTLRLHDLAIRQLRSLKLLLQPKSVKATKTQTQRSTTERQIQTSDDTSELLRFDVDSDLKGPRLQLIVNCQLLTLRLLRSSPLNGRMALPGLHRHLEISTPHSPLNLILKLRDGSKGDEHAANQLEMLAQSLLAITANVQESNSIDDQACERKDLAVACFKIRSIALEIRLAWMDLSRHQGNFDVEIMQAFRKSLRAYIKNSSDDVDVKYELATKTFLKLQNKNPNTHSETKDAEQSSILDVFEELSKLAEASGNLQEASRWHQHLIEAGDNGEVSSVKLILITSRSVILASKKSANDPHWQSLATLIRNAAERLSGPLHGSTADLNELICVIYAVKKRLTIILKSWHGSKQSNSDIGPAAEAARSYLTAGIQFLGRYLGAQRGSNTNVDIPKQEQKPNGAIFQISSSFLESSLLDLRLSVLKSNLAMEHVDVIISACIKLAEILDIHAENGPSFEVGGKDYGQEAGSWFVVMSNIYWIASGATRSQSEASVVGSIEQALVRCCDLLRHRSSCEQRAGDYSMKLYRLGQLLRSSGREKKARHVFQSSIEASINLGDLRAAALLAKSQPLKSTWKSNNQIKLIGKALVAFSEMPSEQDSEQKAAKDIFDMESLNGDERGLLLEKQLLAVTYQKLRNDSTRKKAVELCRRLLNCYESNMFPVRRLRVLVLASSYDIEILDLQVYATALEMHKLEKSHQGLDSEIYCYFPHLRALLQLNWALQGYENSKDNMKAAFDTWKSIMHAVSSETELDSVIDDTEEWLAQLQAAADRLQAQGLHQAQVEVLSVVVKVLDFCKAPQAIRLGHTFTQLAGALLRLGLVADAGGFLAKAQAIQLQAKVRCDQMQLDATYVDYFVATGDLTQAELHVQSLMKSFDEDDFEASTTSPVSKSGRGVQPILYYCDALLACARVRAEIGPLSSAIFYAQRCQKLLRYTWKQVEHRAGKELPLEVENKATVEASLVDGLAALTLSSERLEKKDEHHAASSSGPSFWPLIPRLFSSLMLMSNVFERIGMCQDALCPLDEASNLASISKSKGLAVVVELQKGQYNCRRGDVQQGEKNLQQALDMLQGIDSERDSALLHCFLAYVYRLKNEWETEWNEYSQAETILKGMSSQSGNDSLSKPSPTHVSVTKQNRSTSKAKPLPKTKSKSAKLAEAPGKESQGSAIGNADFSSQSRVPTPFSTLRLHIVCNKIVSLLLQGKVNSAAELIRTISDAALDGNKKLYTNVLLAKVCLNEGIIDIAKDPVCSMLTESTISLPATSDTRCQSTSNQKLNEQKINSSFGGPLHRALNLSFEKRCQLIQIGSTSAISQNLATFAAASMLTSFAFPTSTGVSINPVLVAYAIDIPAVVASVREQQVLRLHQEHQRHKTLYTWRNEPETQEDQDVTALNKFQDCFVEILPTNWTVISMSISEDQQYLCFVHYQAGQDPFVLRLPLNRQSSHDIEEETFTFGEAKAELEEIIQMSDETIHWAREHSAELEERGAKTDWWTEREGLNGRLRDLLVNIENLWLGGFQGILLHHQQNSELLARFHQSFENVLDKYLPSRQRSFKRGATSKVALNRQIFELFVSLGERQADENFDIDEALTDLLYFVVDILQFNGEQNAYDEIDFDSMVVETQDVLSSYLDASQPGPANEVQQHTILILDKKLHAFPWESLGCLQGKSVSRVLSLADIRDRILHMQRQQDNDTSATVPGIIVSPNSGSYVLNPSADLPKTESRFRGPLISLTTWSSLIREAPTSAYLSTALTGPVPTKSTTSARPNILLYIGHGSGMQYIRHKTIKRLSLSPGGCNVALLFGCSSATLKDAGEFEPYGTPKSYLLGGAPAVLGSLWDVTDGDTDRFAGKVLERWGLLDEGTCDFGRKAASGRKVPKTPAKKGGRSRSRKGGDERLCLSEAVARSRGDCYLKYLNGAAMVVYGVPVFLDR